ncbi:hypothetical protein EON81_18240 [bacterium]|nr:MAG: hypothetical protein EON81_18240 [bacterium]
MTQENLNEMSPTEILNLWAEAHKPGETSLSQFLPGYLPPGYRVQTYAPPSVDMPNELVVAVWVHMTVRSLEPLIDELFNDGADVATVEDEIGERVTSAFFDTDRWSYYRRAKYERVTGIRCESARQFGLAIIAKAEMLIAEKMEKFPPKMNGPGPDPDVVAFVRKRRADEKRTERDRRRYEARKVSGRSTKT